MKSTRLLLTVTQLGKSHLCHPCLLCTHPYNPTSRGPTEWIGYCITICVQREKAWSHWTRTWHNWDTAYLLRHLLHPYLKVPVFTQTTSIYNDYYKYMWASICEPLSAASPAHKALKNHLHKIASSHTSDTEKLSAPLLLKHISHLGLFNCSSK